MTTLQQAIVTVRQAAYTGRDLFIVAPVGTASHFLATYYAALVANRAAFRAPHHTVSKVGFMGELALAEGGVFMLDEAPEFRRACLEAIAHGRAPNSVIVATSAPCPCGSPHGECVCSGNAGFDRRVEMARAQLSDPVELTLDGDLTVEELDVLRRLRDDTGHWPFNVELQRLRENQYPQTEGGRPCGQ